MVIALLGRLCSKWARAPIFRRHIIAANLAAATKPLADLTRLFRLLVVFQEGKGAGKTVGFPGKE
jgi:hypothetical protein